MRILGLAPVDGMVLAAYTAMVFATESHHEPWADEAQSWLLGRDLSPAQILFHALQYEGSPGLWHLVNWSVAHARLPYAAIGYLAALFAVAACYLVLRYAPFPTPVRQMLPFTFFLAYQYAVVARSYVLIPLLCFAMAHVIRSDRRPYVPLGVMGGLLANTSIHGCILAGTLLVSFVWHERTRVREQWSVSPRFILIGLGIFAAFVSLAVVSARPAPDCNFITPQVTKLLASNGPVHQSGLFAALFAKAGRAFSVLLFPFAESRVLGGAFLATTLFVLFRTGYLVYALPAAGLMILFSLVYVSSWHTGLLLIAVLTALWVAAPWRTAPLPAVVVFLFFAVSQLGWTWHSVRYDWTGAYDGSKGAADYLKSRGAQPIFGYGPYSAAISAYFDSPVFSNQDSTYWIWSNSNSTDVDPGRIAAERPRFLVICDVDPVSSMGHLARVRREAKAAGYSPQAYFSGRMPMRDGFTEGSMYEIWAALY